LSEPSSDEGRKRGELSKEYERRDNTFLDRHPESWSREKVVLVGLVPGKRKPPWVKSVKASQRTLPSLASYRRRDYAARKRPIIFNVKNLQK